MKTKTKRTGKPVPKGDTTQKQRQSRRRAKLDEIARAAGFDSWASFETHVIHELAKIPHHIPK